MEFSSRLKGVLSQALLKSLLDDAGYRIIPLGVEEVVREASLLPASEYLKLNISKNLKSLPDFFVSDLRMERSWLVEVKYRRRWNDRTQKALYKEILEQVRTWEPLCLLICLGEPFAGNSSPAYSMRVVPLVMRGQDFGYRSWDGTFIPWLEANWELLPRVQDVFVDCMARYQQQTITKAVSVLSKLQELDVFEN